MDQKLNDKKHAPGSGKRNFVEDACMQIRPVLALLLGVWLNRE